MVVHSFTTWRTIKWRWVHGGRFRLCQSVLSPFEEFQRYKTHPEIAKFSKGGKRIGYGARAITAGGFLSLPQLYFKGGVLVGCEAGIAQCRASKAHTQRLKLGCWLPNLLPRRSEQARAPMSCSEYEEAFNNSWLKAELWKARNFKQWFKKGQRRNSQTGIEQKLFRWQNAGRYTAPS